MIQTNLYNLPKIFYIFLLSVGKDLDVKRRYSYTKKVLN